MGYASEALAAILQFAVEQMKVKKVYAHISVDNVASIRTALKLGFVRTGEQYHEVFREKAYLHDIYCLALAGKKTWDKPFKTGREAQ